MANKPMNEKDKNEWSRRSALLELCGHTEEDAVGLDNSGVQFSRRIVDGMFDAGHEHGIRSRDGEVERLATYDRMMRCEPDIQFWAQPIDGILAISQLLPSNKWTWCDEKGKRLPDAPLFDTATEAFVALAAKYKLDGDDQISGKEGAE